MFYLEPPLSSDALAEKMQSGVADAVRHFLDNLPAEWSPSALSVQMKSTLAATGLKMPQLAMPLRLMLMGRTDTPSIDKVMAVLGPDCVRRRIQERLGG
jgi:glutamyl-tRNA synthetase